MQVDLKIPPTKAFFFQTSTVFFPLFLTAVFTLVHKLTVCYIVFKELHYRKYCENCFFFSMLIFILNTKEAHFDKQKNFIRII